MFNKQLVFFLLILFLSNINCNLFPFNEHFDSETIAVTTHAPCGQYGFRCVSPTKFQICGFDSDSSTIDETHDCNIGTVCDEDNSAFCTPEDSDISAGLQQKGNCACYDSEFCNKHSRDTRHKKRSDEIEHSRDESFVQTCFRDETNSNSFEYECSSFGNFSGIIIFL